MPASVDPSEALTRATRIDTELRRAGWATAGVDFHVEYQVGSAESKDLGFLDYLLPDEDGRPLGLVEAKRSSRDALAGKEQARLYADAVEARDGRRPLVFLANGLETWLWDHVSDPRRVSSFLSREDLRRRRYQLENRIPLASVEINSSIVERDYQHAAIRAAQDAFEQGRRRVLWVMATGTGKTRAATALIDTLMRASWAQRVLILTDRVALADQAIEALIEHLPNEPVGRIIFAMSHGHARRIHETFTRSYPQFPGLAEVIDSHVERPQEILRRFKREDQPRVAVTVDMLDTGVDIPTVVNLGLLKPVLSKIKFWQMLGRGTRRVDDVATGRPWCPAGSKDRYRVMDFWGNFERFQLDPDGVAPAVTTPVAVYALRTLVTLARSAERAGRGDLVTGAHTELRTMIAALPTDSSGVRQEQAVVDHVSVDRFWQRLDDAKYRLLTTQVAPLMRYLGGLDLARLAFDSRCRALTSALLDNDGDAVDHAAVQIADDIARLPVGHPEVSTRAALVASRRDERLVAALSPDEVLALAATLGPLMSLRLSDRQPILRLDLEDAFAEQRWLTVGPDAQEYDVATYRTLVEEVLHLMMTTNATLAGLVAGATRSVQTR